MTVAELIEELSALPQDAKVLTWDTYDDGVRDANGTTYDSVDNTVEVF